MNQTVKLLLFNTIASLLAFCLGCTHTSVTTLVPAQPSAALMKQNPGEVIELQAPLLLAAVGDITLGGKRKDILLKHSYDYPFLATRHLLLEADIVIGNLEMALTHNAASKADKKYAFRDSPELVAPALKMAGIDIVSLANNHSMDFGLSGLLDTMKALEANSILHLGAGETIEEARRAQIIRHGDERIGFLAYSNTFPKEFWAEDFRGGTAFGRQAHIEEDVRRLHESGVSNIVVSFHWGRELDSLVRKYQPILARAAIDAGADLIIGHHPHVLQAVEQYKQGLILYSLGNYTFSSFSDRVSHSVIAQVSFRGGRVESLLMTPININNFEVQLQPKVLFGEKALSVYDELSELSAAHGTVLQFNDNKIIYLMKDSEVERSN